MEDKVSTLEELILSVKEESIIFVKGRQFVVSPATESDIARVNSGIILMD
ncbi:hypothetical protein [Paenibacillus gansuensis]|uniref:Uncharacterized protein n=1 Tax=Paenibacillus gansuensis TaxID=306542 RepID=A0ABW5PGN2_9BACL